MNRRTFLGALGVSAASAAFLRGGVPAGDAALYFQDSFGNIVPVAQDSLAAGVVPPPPLAQETSCTTNVSPGYPKYNILLIMVDQLRTPRWLSPAQQTHIDKKLLPNITSIRDMSYVFPNYFVAATNCSPSRATLLTGLYSQQTCMFTTQFPPDTPGPYPPPLQPFSAGGFPSIGDVLSQPLLDYQCTWIGKWHLSANGREPSCMPGGNGPTDYGFSQAGYSIPNPNDAGPYPAAYTSPDGAPNGGNGGEFLDVAVGGKPDFPQGYGTPVPGMTADCYNQINDAAIADAFVKYWLPAAAANPSQKWFTTVSFVNPHDMTHFPYTFGLTESDPTDFGVPSTPPPSGFQPPPTSATRETYEGLGRGESITIAGLDNGLYKGAPADWNRPDDPSRQPYKAGVGGKPGLQAYFQARLDDKCGKIQTERGWLKFLNYYFWLQACVDIQIGNILYGPRGSKGLGLKNSPFWSNTVIVFLSDHGDFGGSHSLHAKGGALYDEALNVPLYISYPGAASPRQTQSITRDFVCSSVDILPFLYALALGNDSWRCNPSDVVNYLSGREAIGDAILSISATQRRVAPGIANASGAGNPPYILHTTDEYASANSEPAHAVAFRTVDPTASPNAGGGKLGVYSFWKPGSITPIVGNPSYPQQYEFYNYSPVSATQTLSPNPGERGNQAFSGGGQAPEMTAYLNSFNSAAVQSELSAVPAVLANAHQAALTAYLDFVEKKQPCTEGPCPG